jgi:glucose/arabinose dehydrogenase
MRATRHACAVAAAVLEVVVVTVIVVAQHTNTNGTGVLKGPAAFGDWRKDKPGVRRLLTPADLLRNCTGMTVQPATSRLWSKDGSLLVTEDGSGTIWRVSRQQGGSK